MAIDITSDGKYLYSVSCDETLRVWNIVKKKQKNLLITYNYPIKCMELTTINNSLINGLDDSTIRVWNVSEKREIAILKDHTEGILK